jgi:N-acyl-D-amino-acid deacylase
MTGVAVPGLESFDRLMIHLLQKFNIPGGALAVTKDGRLVYARGFGLADKEANQPVQPESLFRIGSISKPITAAAILKLVEEGKLDLDAKAFRILDNIQPPPGAHVDPRIYDVTVRNLLQHSGGWDRAVIGEPLAQGAQIAQALGVPCPANKEQIISYIMGLPLPFTPGTRYAYTGFEYSLLGRIIEKLTGQDYEAYVKTNVLASMGIKRMRVGHTRLQDRAEGEVRYYDYPGAPLVAPVCPDEPGPVPAPYAFYMEGGRDASGAWIASAIDLARFVTAVDGRRPPAFLQPETVSLMLSRPAPPLWVGTPSYYAMGWSVRPAGSDANWWHDGGLPGTAAKLVREGQTGQKLSWAVLFNSAPNGDSFGNELGDGLWQAVSEVTSWPANDLFEQYP